MSTFEFQEGCFLRALPSDENRTLFVGGLTESWDSEAVKAVLMHAFPNMRRYVHAFELLSLYCTKAQIALDCSEAMPLRYLLVDDLFCASLMYDALFYSMTSIVDKTNSSKSRPFCFVEFYEHAQALAAYSDYHCTPGVTATEPAPARLVPQQYVNESSDTVGSNSIERLAEQIRGLSCGHDVSCGATTPCMTAQTPATKLPAAAGAATVLMQEGTELKVDWADPLRLYIHMHGSSRQLRGAAGDKCPAKKSAISKLGHRRFKDLNLHPARKQQLLPPHHTSRYNELPPVEPTWWQQQAFTERNLPMQQQLPLPALYRDAIYNSHCPDHQPCFQWLQRTPNNNNNNSFSDFEGLSALQLHRLQMLQAEYNDYMAQYARWT
jgi:RNA recognition motif-containing protein